MLIGYVNQLFVRPNLENEQHRDVSFKNCDLSMEGVVCEQFVLCSLGLRSTVQQFRTILYGIRVSTNSRLLESSDLQFTGSISYVERSDN